MNTEDTLGKVLKIKAPEAKLLLVLFGCDLLRRVASLMLDTASSSMFLYHFSGNQLPIVFMITAVFICFGAMHFLRIKRMPSAAAGLTLIGLAAITLLFYLLYFEFTSLSIALLMIWKTACILLSEITFLLVALRFCDYNWKSWRFIALLLTEAIAMISSGLAVTVLVYFMTPVNLVLISSVLLFGAGFILFRISKQIDDARKESSTLTVEGIKNSSRQLALVSVFFATISFFIIGGYFIDYAFYKTVYRIYGEWLSDMTAFFAMYQVFAGFFIIAIILLFRRYQNMRGLKLTPLTLPFFLLVGAIGCLTGVLWVIAFSCIGKDAFYKLLMTPTAKTFSVPLLPSLGKKLSAIRRIMIEPFSVFVAGFILLRLENTGMLKELPLFLLACAVFVSLLALIAYRIYNLVVTKTLKNRYWWGGRLYLEDKTLLHKIEQQTLNNDVESSIYFLRVLEVARNYNVKDLLIKSLSHPSERVRLFALSRLEALNLSIPPEILSNLIKNDASSEVKNRALQVYCVLGGDNVFDKTYLYLNDKAMMEGAAIGLLKSGPEGSFLASQALSEMLEGDTKQKIQAARIIGKAKISAYYRPLLKLMHDSAISVRKAAVVAAGKLRNPKLCSDLLFALSVPELREDASEGLLKLGNNGLKALNDFLLDEDTPFSLKSRAVNIISGIGGVKSRDILLEALPSSSRYLRGVILRALTSREYRFKYGNTDILHQCLDEENYHIEWLASCLWDINQEKEKNNSEAAFHLQEALTKEISFSEVQIKNLKTLLSYYGDILPSLSFSSHHPKEGREQPSTRHLPLNKRLQDIMVFAPRHLHAWTLACAVYYAGCLKDKSLKDSLLKTAEGKDSLVRETSVWALGKIASKKDLKDFVARCFKDDCPEVSRMAHFVFD